MHGCLFDNGYLNVLYGMRLFCWLEITDDPGGNGGCDSGLTECT